jgi:hypothetical protein
MATFRKNTKGEWVVYGTTSEVRVGKVTVSKKDGPSKTVTVTSLGAPFRANGVAMVYGYLGATKSATPRPTPVATAAPVTEDPGWIPQPSAMPAEGASDDMPF